uniref:Uncharacterized protein n=1 Tax=Medicago truncatula TaxID=3880 RepID=I3SWI2_MEDTR|nr:unknown [Medicago truncatula]
MIRQPKTHFTKKPKRQTIIQNDVPLSSFI